MNFLESVGEFSGTFAIQKTQFSQFLVSESPANMSDFEEEAVDVVKKKQKKEKRVKKKAEDDENGASEVASKEGKNNKKKRKRDEVQLTEEEIALAKAERNRKKWKKRDAKVRDRKLAKTGLNGVFVRKTNHVFCLFGSMLSRLQQNLRQLDRTRRKIQFNSAVPLSNKISCGTLSNR